ncbi:lipopolysaccharide biosynthesis protein [Clostridium sp. UBA4548]|uniref:lipopolysaccharide biosynthesis protein n=1 Tax=Clostridium sp. UBA4548 TaxID=1946361 RepID=UPI0025B94849|nr:hypothetical protein [Clostridium sp. UBA4548]
MKHISINNKKGILKDFILNILASLVFTFATQIIAYPYLSRMMSNKEYGLLLTVMGIVNSIGVSLGNPLNNTRILLQPQYEKKGLSGDYNIIFIACILLDIVVVFILSSIVLNKEWLSIIGCIAISVLVLFRAYYSASYRITINYRKNLYLSIFGFLGYIFGIGITYKTGLWIATFLFGELLSCIYIFFTATIIHDRFQITELFNTSLKKYLLIMTAAILSTMMTYMDRFFIYPILGAEQVAIYNVASFLGKTAGIVMNPIAGVLLTYYAKEEEMTISQFYKRTGIFVGFCILFYFGILLFGIPITRILYPTIANSTKRFFAISNLATTVFILGNIIQPTLLRFCSAKWQPIIQGVYFIIYILLGILGMKSYGLVGFCYSVLIANTVKIIMMISITTWTLYNNKKGGNKNE